MTREEWEAARAHEQGISLEQLHEYFRKWCLTVKPCACDYAGCEGWIVQMDYAALMDPRRFTK